MLPKESSKGFEAYKRLRVFIGVPEELKNRPKIKIPSADASLLKGEYVYVYEVAKALGWKGE
jgi:LSU ribosomal protein L13P